DVSAHLEKRSCHNAQGNAGTVNGFNRGVMRGLDPPAGPKPLRRGEGPRIHRKRVFALSMDCRVKPGNDESAKTVSLHTRFGEARRTRGLRTLAQVEPPGRGEAGRVESEINDQRELRA